MNTIKEYQDLYSEIQFSIEKVEQVKLWGKIQDLLDKLVKNGKIFLKLIDILAKYFYVNNKLTAPNPLKFWVYIKLVAELYNFFKNLKNEDNL